MQNEVQNQEKESHYNTIPILDKLDANDKERFWSNVDIQQGNRCWEWKGRVSERGYGLIMIEGERNPDGSRNKYDLKAHRVAKVLSEGVEIPPGMIVRHKACDNPPCCNPDHLEIGTHDDNMLDMHLRRRGNIDYTKPNKYVDVDIYELQLDDDGNAKFVI